MAFRIQGDWLPYRRERHIFVILDFLFTHGFRLGLCLSSGKQISAIYFEKVVPSLMVMDGVTVIK